MLKFNELTAKKHILHLMYFFTLYLLLHMIYEYLFKFSVPSFIIVYYIKKNVPIKYAFINL